MSLAEAWQEPERAKRPAVVDLGPVDVGAMADWIAAIPISEWTRQRIRKGIVVYCMQRDTSWHGFGKMSQPVIDQLLKPGQSAYYPTLSIVMPGQVHPPHTDAQDERFNWLYRVHVPLTSNPKAFFITDEGSHHFQVGRAYAVNTYARHSIVNEGETPRVHLLFDVRA